MKRLLVFLLACHSEPDTRATFSHWKRGGRGGGGTEVHAACGLHVLTRMSPKPPKQQDHPKHCLFCGAKFALKCPKKVESRLRCLQSQDCTLTVCTRLSLGSGVSYSQWADVRRGPRINKPYSVDAIRRVLNIDLATCNQIHTHRRKGNKQRRRALPAAPPARHSHHNTGTTAVLLEDCKKYKKERKKKGSVCLRPVSSSAVLPMTTCL